ncbi:MAG TPA: anaerobic ribonucleoside-triphosphate reductase [Candidatus Bathyarchaeia archaeon]|nr:anaerobic ribonucleoside-triphosphate reductase [Candidatus Bathyarchaeia archaeon]
MSLDERKNQRDPEDEPRVQPLEGLFDAQLTFSAPFIEAPQPVKEIVKRDGRVEPFDKNKIADTIFKAAASIGGNDRERAANLASAIAIYLSKTLDSRPPTVDQVGDAVEKVLIEMGHARTALAYARYRDRRARIRRLRQGDTAVILNELAEARRSPGGLEGGEGSGVLVRTGGEQLRAWDRAKIAEALIRETGLEEGTAQLIALEVEQQIKTANVKTLTTGLVRELVNAKLIERGLEAHWRRHVRLGVPLYDARRIICGLDNAGAATVDPERTSRVLAQSVKREYAVSQVFSPEVGDAHLRGDIYLHDLGRIDCLDSAALSVAGIAKYGVGLPDSRAFSRPPKYADTLLAQMVNSSGVLQHYFSGAITWDALNIHFAPFLESCEERALHQLAQMLIYEYAYRAAVHGDCAPETAIGLYWDAPPHLKELEAVSAGGRPAGKTYGDYSRPAQQFLWALLDVFKEGGVQGVKFTSPSVKIHITPDFFRSPGSERFLEHAGEVAASRGNVLFALERAPEPVSAAPWDIRDVTAHRVTLNLPRLAYRSRGTTDFFEQLAATFELAAQAHSQKAGFVHKLMALESLGPLGLLAAHREGRPAVDVNQAKYLVGVSGLSECVWAATGLWLAQSEQAVAFAVEILSRIAGLCAESSERLGLQVVPAQTVDTRIARRFAAIDLEAWQPQTSQVLDRSDAEEPAYTPGVRISGGRELSPMERVRLEGRFQCFLDGDAATVVQMPDSETSPKSVADFIRKAYHQTGARRILVEALTT